jgi:hypothetical protein
MRIKDIDRELADLERREASQPPIANSWMVERQQENLAQLVGRSTTPPLPQSEGAKAFLSRLFRNERLSLDGVFGRAYSDSIVLSRATVVPMQTRERYVWGFDSSDGSAGNLFGGLEPTWHAETSTESVQTAELTQIRLTAYTLFLLAQSSDELIEDGPSFAEEPHLERIQ